MNRTIFGVIFIGVLAACGSNNGATHACGDGIVNGSEQCDDGNTISGDGCSSACQIETANTCGDGIVQVATETCDDGNTVDGDGCDSHCHIETSTTCGNGTLDANEACDDGNHNGNDGCSAQCTVEPGYTCTGTPSVCTMGSTAAGTCAAPISIALTGTTTLTGMATGDTTSATNQVNGDCDDYPDDSEGNDQILKFTLAAASPVDIVLDPQFDGNVRLLTAPCDVTTAVTDANEADGCSDAGFELDKEYLRYANLPAGTYYVVVDSYDPTEFGSYTVTVSAGNLCGNGILDPGEECEDGNNANGDRCSSTCVLESDITEVEPNDTTAQVITPANHIIRGSLTAGDVDLYTFTLTTATTVQIETYDTMDPSSDYLGVSDLMTIDCATDNSYIFLFDSTGDVTNEDSALASDDFDGDYDDVNFASQCAYIGPMDSDGDTTQGVLQPGTYTIKVKDYFGDAETRYMLDVRFGTGMPVAPLAGDLAINEVMLADNASDTNCDGSTTDTVDEFVELVNVTNHQLDLTGVTISDAAMVRHTFAAGATGSMTLDPGKAMVVWGGGAPACPGVTDWFVASTGSLGLNDGGDTVTITNAAATVVSTYTFGASTINKSFNLSPDVTGTTYALHDAITGHMGAYSPGKKNDGTAF